MSRSSDERENDIENTGDDIPQEVEIEDIEEASADTLKMMRKKLKECEDAKRSHLEELQRAKADFLNARRRLEEQATAATARGAVEFIERLLPLYDSFNMAMKDNGSWEKVDATWRAGIEGIYKELQSIFASYGVNIIHPLNEPFDHTLHEAVDSEVTGNEKLHDTVTAVLQDGITRTVDDSTIIIRPARVRVGKFESH